MKKKATSQSAFFNLRILTAALFCLLGIAVALFAQGKGTKQTQQINRSTTNQDAPVTQTPEVTRMVGPVILTQDLRKLPYVAPNPEFEERVLTRYPHGTEQTGGTGAPAAYGTSGLKYVQALLKNMWRPATMPPPLLTFEGGAA